jgi:Tfp pilus assembly protein PilF
MSAPIDRYHAAKGRGASQPASFWRVAGLCAALAAITFSVFGQTLRHEFVDYDDDLYVYDNPVVVQGLTGNGTVWALTQAHAGNWHPLTWLSHMLDCQLYGLGSGGHHLTSVLLHAATVILLFLVLRQMTGALWRSAFVAAVFAIHPLRAESVAWVAERKDVLSGLFFMLTIGAYAWYARRPGTRGRYGLLMLLFAMGLMCKPMLVTLPVVLLLLDYWPLQRVESLRKLIVEKLPLLALSAASCAVTFSAQHAVIRSGGSFSLSHRLGNAVTACAGYLGQLVYPAGLSVFYPFPPSGAPVWKVALAGTLLACLSVAAWKARRTRPWLLIGWVWYLAMLLPVLGIIQAGRQAHADRYTYLPQIGIVVAATWLAAEWRASRRVLGGLMAGVLAVLMFCAWKQTAYWKNSETLWNHALACTTDNDVAHCDLGNIFRDRKRWDDAIFQYQQALQINPDYVEAHNNLANIFFQTGRVDDAITQYEKALQINPALAATHNNLGAALLQKGRVDEAIARFREALQIKPGFVEAQINLGGALLQNGNVAEVIALYQKALKLAPANRTIQNNLAWLLATSPQASLRNGDEAVQLARQATEQTGGKNPVFLRTLAAALAETGRFGDAVRNAQQAAQIAQATGQQDLASHIIDELSRYQAGLPFHQ